MSSRKYFSHLNRNNIRRHFTKIRFKPLSSLWF